MFNGFKWTWLCLLLLGSIPLVFATHSVSLTLGCPAQVQPGSAFDCTLGLSNALPDGLYAYSFTIDSGTATVSNVTFLGVTSVSNPTNGRYGFADLTANNPVRTTTPFARLSFIAPLTGSFQVGVDTIQVRVSSAEHPGTATVADSVILVVPPPPDPCAGITCQNSGTCASGVCTCVGGFTGTRCETQSPPPASCTDGIRNQDETSVDYGGSCPARCGNNLREWTEQCDGTDLGGKTCSPGELGALACDAECRLIDNCYTESCSDDIQNQGETGVDSGGPCPARCGDGIVQPGEHCDGNNLNGQSCASLNLGEGTLSCNACNLVSNCVFPESRSKKEELITAINNIPDADIPQSWTAQFISRLAGILKSIFG